MESVYWCLRTAHSAKLERNIVFLNSRHKPSGVRLEPLEVKKTLK